MKITCCISKITMFICGYISLFLRSSDADNVKKAILRSDSMFALFCFWAFHLHTKKSAIVFHQDILAIPFNLFED